MTATLNGSATMPNGENKPGSAAFEQVQSMKRALATQAIDQVRSLRKTLPWLVDGESDLQDELFYELRKLSRETESKYQCLQRICWLGPWEQITTCIAVNMGMFELLSGADSPMSVADIAARCNAEPFFTQRLLRCLDALGCVEQQSVRDDREPLYSANKATRAFTGPFGESTSRWLTEMMVPAWYRLPGKLRETGYKSTESGHDTIFNDMYNAPGKSLWDIIGEKTPYAKDVGSFMAEFEMDRKHWSSFYPIQERLLDGAAADGILMVDVGGNTGSQIAALREQFPDAPGKCMILDLPTGVPANPPAGTETCAHSFFEPFPPQAHGARFYYMRWISHNWSQKELITMLTNIRGAMKPGYSKLVINDWIVPDRDPHPFMCSQDLCMMQLGGGEERSEARHRQAIEAAGLKVAAIFKAGDGRTEDVIECELLE